MARVRAPDTAPPLLGGGGVLVTGGVDIGDGPAQVELYDPATRQLPR